MLSFSNAFPCHHIPCRLSLISDTNHPASSSQLVAAALRSLAEFSYQDNFYLSIALIIILGALSAVFSGLTLTLGLMVLDVVQLQVLIQSAAKQPHNALSQREARRAKRIYRLRKDGNLLLVTMLISNVAVNSAFSIVASGLTNGLVGFILSTSIITVFGEIVPQAICSRYGLVIGYYLCPMVLVTEILLYVVAKPIAMMLDCALGRKDVLCCGNGLSLALVVLLGYSDGLDDNIG